MNYMSEVAKMLGVELGERFHIKFNNGFNSKYHEDNEYYLCESGVKLDKKNHACISSDMLLGILSGAISIKRKPFRPKKGEEYWSVEALYGDAVCIHWSGCWGDIMYYKVGNCYRTQEEAEMNRDKWLAFYASNEVLEV